MSKFQIILLVVFGAFILLAVILFSTNKNSNSGSANILIWGDIPSYDFNVLLNNSNLIRDKSIIIQYVEITRDNFDSEFTEALALGKGPDLVILPMSKIWKNRNKLLLLPPESISPKDFSSTFVEQGELLVTNTGTYALPVVVDPLVLYWNRDLFTKAAFTAPPKYWDEIYPFAEKLTEKDSAGNIKIGAIALGEGKNIPNAKDILSLLMLQAGTPITGFDGEILRSRISENYNLPLVPAQAALDFYTQFSNPAKPFYSWNRAMLSAPTAFASGDVAMYIGYASELPELKAKNPTLNIGVVAVPQSRVSGKNLTFSQMEGVAVVKNTQFPAQAFNAALFLVSKETSFALSNIMKIAPARRDLLSTRPNDAAQSVFYEAAIQSKGWIDPDDIKTNKIFLDMIESVTSGRARIQEAVDNANSEINVFILK